MRLIRGLHNLTRQFSGSVVSLGNFDGVHLGHQRLINALTVLKKQHQLPIVVIVFEPQPKEFFAKQATVARVMRFTEKYRLLESLGVDYVCCLYFNAALAALSAEAFVDSILLKHFSMKAVVVGHDFHFGAKRAGDVDLLRQIGKQRLFSVQQIPAVMLDNEVVSSTRLRYALALGDMLLVKRLLGRYYSVWGKVGYGQQRGRALGFPTANLNLHRELVPLSGVFVVRVKLKGAVINGVANVGVRPTFDGTRVLLEAHLFDFDRSIYGESLEVAFLHKIRDERPYHDFSALVAQINRDVQSAKDYFQS